MSYIVQSKENHPKQSKIPKKQKQEFRLAVHDTERITNVNKIECVVCKSDKHEIVKCPQFLEFPPGKRIDKVVELRLCRTCLKFHNSYCNIHDRCGVDGCRRFHHFLLHKAKSPTPTNSSQNKEKNDKS